jgi:transcriptional regulator with XRE-family HTH domain
MFAKATMRKTFMGVRLKKLREQRGLTQAELAFSLSLSPSYLNQLENNQRPLTVPVLLRLQSEFDVDVQWFSEDDEARLTSELREVFAMESEHEPVSSAEIQTLAGQMLRGGRPSRNRCHWDEPRRRHWCASSLAAV